MIFLYRLALIAFSPFLYIFLWRADRAHPRYKGTVAQRLGRLKGVPPKKKGLKRVWIHAVSVGEASGATALLKEIRARDAEDVEAVVSTSTIGGMDYLERNAGGLSAHLFYFPIDFPWTLRRVWRQIAPDEIILLETELWPNLIELARKKQTPCLILNGRVSDRMAGAGALLRSLYRALFARLSAIGVQYERDRERIEGLGAPKGFARVLGNVKLDGLGKDPDPERLESLKRAFCPDQGPLMLAGSTHEGEEAAMLEIFPRLRKDFAEFRIVICPRHVERADEVFELCRSGGWKTARRSNVGPDAAWDILILDTTGELGMAYRLCDVAFVGGSLIQRGGHNLLEPAGCGRTPFYGPSVENFAAQADMLREADAGIQASDAADLAQAIREYLADPERKVEIDERARLLILENQGASKRSWELARSFLGF